ncbi:proline-rich protein HaeIII subfamily 1-like [Pituophis catenifer annectens]|uniref:proline-rich protein HaeIII subfamily 1-like n=1 Tax=Pituophis catenifer annectens TaxID=94852 RepID=UPI0039922819
MGHIAIMALPAWKSIASPRPSSARHKREAQQRDATRSPGPLGEAAGGPPRPDKARGGCGKQAPSARKRRRPAARSPPEQLSLGGRPGPPLGPAPPGLRDPPRTSPPAGPPQRPRQAPQRRGAPSRSPSRGGAHRASRPSCAGCSCGARAVRALGGERRRQAARCACSASLPRRQPAVPPPPLAPLTGEPPPPPPPRSQPRARRRRGAAVRRGRARREPGWRRGRRAGVFRFLHRGSAGGGRAALPPAPMPAEGSDAPRVPASPASRPSSAAREGSATPRRPLAAWSPAPQPAGLGARRFGLRVPRARLPRAAAGAAQTAA